MFRTENADRRAVTARYLISRLPLPVFKLIPVISHDVEKRLIALLRGEKRKGNCKKDILTQ